MNNLSSADNKYLINALRFIADNEFDETFNDFKIDINNDKYCINGKSRADKLQAFFKLENSSVIGKVLIELGGYLRNMELGGRIFKHHGFSEGVTKIGEKLVAMPPNIITPQTTEARVKDNQISIEIRPEIYKHIKRYLDEQNYFHAVEESYKFVREKLRNITGHEQAHKAFAAENYVKIFGHAPQNDAEADFFQGIKLLHEALQKFRNEKVHVIASDLERNLAIHYLSLASLAYDLISRNDPE